MTTTTAPPETPAETTQVIDMTDLWRREDAEDAGQRAAHPMTTRVTWADSDGEVASVQTADEATVDRLITEHASRIIAIVTEPSEAAADAFGRDVAARQAAVEQATGRPYVPLADPVHGGDVFARIEASTR